MVADMVERSCELVAPVGLALPGPAVDEVEAEAGKERGGELNRGKRLGDRVLAPERLEVGVAQRLHADRQAIDAGGAIAAKPPRLDAGRVGFERDLGVRLEPPSGGDRVDDALHGLRAHERRRAAAEKHRARRPGRAPGRPDGRFRLGKP